MKMKLKLKAFYVIVLLGILLLVSNVTNAVTMPNISDIIDEKIDTQNYDGTDYPDLRNINILTTIYAYSFPKYGHNLGNNSSLPHPFDVYHANDGTGTQTFYVGTYKVGNEYHANLIYCSGYRVRLNGNWNLPYRDENSAVYGWDGVNFSPEVRNDISLALIFGFDADTAVSTVSHADAARMMRNGTSSYPGLSGTYVYQHTWQVFGTQVATWLASTQQIGSENEDAIMRHFFTVDGAIENVGYDYCRSVIEKVKKAKQIPSYSSKNINDAPVYELAWNGSRFECELTDLNGLNTADRIAIVQDMKNSGINCDVDGDRVILWTNTAVGTRDNPVTLSANKVINNGVGVAGFWQHYTINNGSYCQPMTRLLPLPRETETTYYKAYTSGIRTSVYKDITSTTGDLGEASPEGAVYGIYRNPECTSLAATVTIGANGYSNKTDYIPYQTYYVKEIKESASTVIDNNVYTIDPATATTDEDGDFAVRINVTDKVIENSLEIRKYIGATKSSEKSPLAGAEFTARLDTDPTKTYKATTDANGYCIIENMPYGHYTIEETVVPSNTLKCSDFKLFVKEDKSYRSPYTLRDVTFVNPQNNLDTVVKQWLDENGNLVDEPKVMRIRIRKVDKDGWEGKEKVDFTQGDAVLKGAIYEVYEWQASTNSYSKFIENTTVDKKDSEGYWYAESSDLLVGKKYMVKEKVKFVDTVDGVEYKHSFAEGYLVDETEFKFYQEPETQTTKRTYQTEVSKEEVQRGRISVIKYDNQELSSDESPAKGAILRLTLDKDPGVYYDVRIDEKGFAEFIDRNDADGSHATSIKTCYGSKYYPYTIPYGQYTITEVKASDTNEHTSYYIQPVPRKIDKQARDIYNTILADEPIKMRLKIVKKDSDTKQNITNNPAVFQIYDCENKEMLKFMTMEGEKDRLQTNEEGWFYTPQELLPGKYVLYEVDSPNAYYLDPKLKLPENKKDFGNTNIAGQEIDLNKIIEAEVIDKNNPKEYVHTIEVENEPLKGKVEVIKTGEMLTGYKTEDVTGLDGEIYTVTKPVYEYKALEGVEYTLTAKEDIKAPDGVIWEAEGTKHVITTNSEGYAISEELYCGTYTVEETKTPLGFKTDENILDVTVVNTDKNERVKTISKEYKNQKIPTQIDVEKVLAEDEYDLSEDKVGVILGIYANEDIKNYNQTQTVIKKGTLLDVIEGRIQAGEKMTLTSDVNLPEGKYYVKELYVDYPYTVDVNDKGFEVKFDSTRTDKALVKGIVINNDIPVSASIGFIKLSTSFLTGDLNNSKIGGYLSDEELAKEQSLITEWVNNTPFDTVMAVLRGEEEAENIDIARYRLDAKYKLSEATYEIYKDKELTKPLTKEGKVVSITTDENGVGKVDKLPIGEYYLKETKAPKIIYEDEEFEYDKELGEIKIVLSYDDEDQNIARILFDDMASGIEIIKTDIFTSELVPNCRFEIRDSNDELIVDATTDEEGKFKMPIDLFTEGETYTYTEKEAPEMYDIDTTPHEFTLKLDENGKPIPVKVDNTRKSKELRILKVDEETGEPLKDCVFSIALLDENGEIKTREDGTPIYLVENAVTDENGEYLIEKAYYGTYKFTEVQAPEGYELSEKDMEGYIFTIDEDSADRIDFVITNTGDIAVIALASILLVSAIGIVSVLGKKYIKQ